jgi:hypothetical protein
MTKASEHAADTGATAIIDGCVRITELRLPLDHGAADLRAAIVRRLGIDAGALRDFSVFRRGHDARRRRAIVLVYTVDCVLDDAGAVLARFAHDAHVRPAPDTSYRLPEPPHAGARSPRDRQAPVDLRAVSRPRPVVVGFGPCGIFAALLLAQMGLAPIVLERGRDVRRRTRDTWGLWRRGELDAESNVQFGEGGAGTFSDGKLWSRIGDPRHLTRKVLRELVAAGAPEEILWIAKPHIGTFRLVGVVERMRQAIVALGGEVRFGAHVVDLLVDDLASGTGTGSGTRARTRHVRGVVLAGGEVLRADHVVLSPGHSARDTFAMLVRRGVHVLPKPFSIGLRIEHPQHIVDRARFGAAAGHPLLGAADYRLVHHARNGRGVYSFCMCPGGTVVAATSEPGRVVTNGMSQYSRNERNANAGIVVGLGIDDFAAIAADAAGASAGGSVRDDVAAGDADSSPALAGVRFQRFYEARAFLLGGGGYRAPGQRVGDFLAGRPSSAFGGVEPSYRPGVQPGDLADPRCPSLPGFALDAIREALPVFERQLRGFAMADAVLTGVETRTSSPVRIARDDDDLQSLNVAGLFPAGEGAGYAGGIMSAGVDGIEVAEAVARALHAALR